MRAIISGKLYDTDTANEIFTQIEITGFGYMEMIRPMRIKIYKTKNGNYFKASNKEIIRVMSEKEVKEYILNKDIDKYLKLFGSDGIEEG